MKRLHIKREFTVKIHWEKRVFTTMNAAYRRVREGVGGGMMSCFVCERDFEDGEPFALANVIGDRVGSRNVTLCHACLDAAEDFARGQM